MKNTTCCFAGHRKLPGSKLNHIMKRLPEEIDRLTRQGVKTFISGVAVGFDLVAASMIYTKKEMGEDIRLKMALPCRNQDEFWPVEPKRIYRALIHAADEVHYVSDEYTPDCMKLRNYFMVDNSGYCICALIHDRSGTGQTVRYALKKGVMVINVID